MKKPNIEITRHKIGSGYPTYIVAELSGNHRQNFDEAVKLVKAAKKARANAVKLQTYTPETITIKCNSSEFRIKGGTPWDGKTLYDLYSETYMPWKWQPKLKRVADDLGIDLFSTPFDKTAVDFLEYMDVPAYKVASFELVDIPLIEYIGAKGKPIIMSTGMSTLDDIGDAVRAARRAGASQIALLKCTSAYPAQPEQMNLRTIPDLAKKFGVPVGLSDHTIGIAVPVTAIALGACIVEKHFTISRSVSSPDSAFSLEPNEFRAMVEAIRESEKALGGVKYEVGKQEAKSLVFRRSLFVVKDMRAGEIFTEDNVRSIRPGYGLPPKYLKDVLGRRAVTKIRQGTPLNWELVS